MYVSWTNHTAHLTVSMVKDVTCEKCQTKYAYALERTESGQGVSLYGIGQAGAADRAAANAAEKLQNSLSGAFEVVPCPNCGHLQTQMVVFLKNAYFKWMVLLGAVLGLGSIVALAWSVIKERPIGLAMAAVLFVAGVALIFVRSQLVERYDPNAGDPEPRKQLGRSLAVRELDAPPAPTAAPDADAPPTDQGRLRRRRR